MPFANIVRAHGDGFRLGLEYFTHHRTGPEMSWAEADKTPTLGKMFSEEMEKLLGPKRNPRRAARTETQEFGVCPASAA